MKYAIFDGSGSSLAYYEAATPTEALHAFLADKLHALTLLFDCADGKAAVIHDENGRPAELVFDGETFRPVPVLKEAA